MRVCASTEKQDIGEIFGMEHHLAFVWLKQIHTATTTTTIIIIIGFSFGPTTFLFQRYSTCGKKSLELIGAGPDALHE